MKGKLKYFLGGVVTVAMLSISVFAAPPNALAGGKMKIPPGQAKKVNFKVMNDVKSHWAAEPVTVLQKEGIIKGFPDGNYYPQNNVSRAETLVMVMRALNLEGGNPSNSALKAVEDCPEWARETVALALDKGILTSQEVEDLDFTKPALRYEVAVWIGRAQNGTITEAAPTFIDTGKIPGYAKKYVAFMAKNKIINGYPGNLFGPLNSVKRAEIAAMLFRCQNTFSLSPNFGFIRGEIKDVLPGDTTFIILAVENGDEDSEAPQLYRLSPKDGASNVEIGLKELVVTFDENIFAVDSESDIESNIDITNVTEDEAVEISDIDIDGKELIIQLVDGLSADCKYTVNIPDDIIKDEDGNKFAGIDDSDWEFTTAEDEDNTAPGIDSLDPENNDDIYGDVDEISVKFDEDVQWVDDDDSLAEDIMIYYDNSIVTPDDVNLDGDELVISFDENLPNGEYRVIIPAGIIEDTAGNEFKDLGVSNSWSFEIK